MKKEVAAFTFIIFGFVVLVTWWAVSAFQIPPEANQIQIATNHAVSDVDDRYALTAPVQIYHTDSHGTNVYTGSLTIPSCDNFLTGISASGNQPAHLRLSFTITRQDATCGAPSPTLAVPFSVTYSSTKSTKKPIVDGVDVNNTAAAFSVIESATQ